MFLVLVFVYHGLSAQARQLHLKQRGQLMLLRSESCSFKTIWVYSCCCYLFVFVLVDLLILIVRSSVYVCLCFFGPTSILFKCCFCLNIVVSFALLVVFLLVLAIDLVLERAVSILSC